MHSKLHDLSELSIVSLAQIDAAINGLGLLPILEKRRGTIGVLILVPTIFEKSFIAIFLALLQVEHVFRQVQTKEISSSLQHALLDDILKVDT